MSKNNIKDLFQQFINECRFSSALARETLKSYQSAFDTFIKIMPEIDLDNLCSTTVTEFFKRLDERERIVGRGIIKKGIKKSTIATYRSKLTGFFKWLKIKGYIDKNPFLEVKYPNVKYEDRRFLSKEEVNKIFTAVGFNIDWKNSLVKKRNILIFNLLLNCGLRKGELAGLMMNVINLEQRVLTVMPETSKMRRKRTVPINTKVMQSLKDYLDERKKLGYKTPSLLVSANRDRGLKFAGLKSLVDKVKKYSGVSFHLHRFRHTFAVNVLKQGASIAELKELLGHVDIRMTAGYLRCIPNRVKAESLERLSLDNLV